MKSECVLRVLPIFLKPENILIDFGLADNDAFYVWKTLGCTKEYASPELLSQSKDIDSRSDIYSIGIVMREIFGGRYKRIQKKCTSDKREKRYSDLTELQRVWNGRNKIWKLMAALSVVVAIAIPTLLYMSLQKGKEQKINQRDMLIQEVKASSNEQRFKPQNHITIPTIMHYELCIRIKKVRRPEKDNSRICDIDLLFSISSCFI